MARGLARMLSAAACQASLPLSTVANRWYPAVPECSKAYSVRRPSGRLWPCPSPEMLLIMSERGGAHHQLTESDPHRQSLIYTGITRLVPESIYKRWLLSRVKLSCETVLWDACRRALPLPGRHHDLFARVGSSWRGTTTISGLVSLVRSGSESNERTAAAGP